MKKLLTVCMILCLLLSATSALAEDTVTVYLGDGAPIAYFDGYESNAAVNPDALSGVTGAVDASIYMDFEQAEYDSIYEMVNYNIRLQNIAVTDDYIALFMQQEYEKDIPFPEGRMQYHINRTGFLLTVMQGGEYIAISPVVREGHLLDEKTLAFMVVYPLEKQIDLTQPISLYAERAKDGSMDGLHLMLDASQRNDPATVVAPGLEVKTQPNNEGSVSTTTITRIACTPFGLRVALDVLDDGQTFGFGYAVLDGEGRYLPQMNSGWTSHSYASAEHPMHMYNDLWLLTADVPDCLQIVPTQGDVDTTPPQEFSHYIPFGDTPVDVSLPSGTVMRVEGVDVEADGYLLRCSLPAYTFFGLDIDLANVQGERLNLNVISFDMPNLREGTLGYGGYWSEEYKGEVVAKVASERLAQATGLYLNGWEYDSRLQMDQAIEVQIR